MHIVPCRGLTPLPPGAQRKKAASKGGLFRRGAPGNFGDQKYLYTYREIWHGYL